MSSSHLARILIAWVTVALQFQTEALLSFNRYSPPSILAFRPAKGLWVAGLTSASFKLP